MYRRVIYDVAGCSHLDCDAHLHRALCHATGDLVEQEIRRRLLHVCRLEILRSADRLNAITAILANSVRVRKLVGADCKKIALRKAGRYRLWRLHELECGRMRAKKPLERCWLGRIGTTHRQRTQEFHKLLYRSDEEPIHGVSN